PAPAVSRAEASSCEPPARTPHATCARFAQEGLSRLTPAAVTNRCTSTPGENMRFTARCQFVLLSTVGRDLMAAAVAHASQSIERAAGRVGDVAGLVSPRRFDQRTHITNARATSTNQGRST